MDYININTGTGYKFLTFPDGQIHVNIGDTNVYHEKYHIVCSITSLEKLFQLLAVSNAIDNLLGIKVHLVIPYLMGARSDRVMQKGDSVDLKVIADLINSMGFQRVDILDVHSDVALQLIKNSVNIDNRFLVEKYKEENAVLICPDAGAVKKVEKYLQWNWELKDVVYCIKSRDLKNKGKITLKVLEPEKCIDRNCVIIDDLADGAGTFIGIAQQIKPKHLALIVTHGIFSKGFEELSKHFNKIIVSNSFKEQYPYKHNKMEIQTILA